MMKLSTPQQYITSLYPSFSIDSISSHLDMSAWLKIHNSFISSYILRIVMLLTLSSYNSITFWYLALRSTIFLRSSLCIIFMWILYHLAHNIFTKKKYLNDKKHTNLVAKYIIRFTFFHINIKIIVGGNYGRKDYWSNCR